MCIVAAEQIDLTKLPPRATNQVDFARDIQPIFERSCLRCHGPDRPKSKYRLDNRESALRGGEEHTDDIVPGRSAESKLIHYVARFVPDLEMPPKGKGDPLTTNEIALLRAWIDQGAIWETSSSGPQIIVAPTVGGILVSGDSHMFREHFWRREDWNPGFEEFSITDRIGNDGKATLIGRALRDDYRISLILERRDVGFTRFGAERYRKYFDDSGGYFPKFFPSVLSLDRDLHLDQGRAWVDFGLTVPDWPKLTVGYEYQFRQGEKSTLQWGFVNQGSYFRNVYPAAKAIDERVHIVKVDVEHDLAGVHFDDSFRGEFYDLKTGRQNTKFFFIDDPAVHFRDDVKEGYKYFQGANALRAEKAFTDWLLGSGGYRYSKLNADATFSLDPLLPFGFPTSDFDQWQSREIVLKRETHAFNAAALFGPWTGLSLSVGVLNEWTRQEGFGSADKDVILSSMNMVSFDANHDKAMVEESVALRYTSIPFTTLFAEARLQQESIGEFGQEVGGPTAFLRDTDASSERSDWRVGFSTSPWKRVSFNANYRRSDKETDYDHRRDDSNQAISGNGYPAFIRHRDIDTDEIEGRLVVRPWRWVKTTFTYKSLTTRYDTVTDSAGLTDSSDISPGGRAPLAVYRAHFYSFNATLTPWQRWYLSGTFSYQHSGIVAFANEVPQVVPYRGDVYSVLAGATVLMNQKTDLQVTYGLSRADYTQDNFEEGLPVGIKYTRHAVTAGITRRLVDFLSARLQYGFYHYAEPSSAGANNYNAHAVFGTLVLYLK
jgi:hypothetical protein